MNSHTTSAPPVRSAATIAEYHTTQKYLKNWGYKIGSFADWLISQPKLTHATKLKHIRQARILAKENSKSWNLGSLPPLPDKSPPHFSDHDFQCLYQAFENVQISPVHPPRIPLRFIVLIFFYRFFSISS